MSEGPKRVVHGSLADHATVEKILVCLSVGCLQEIIGQSKTYISSVIAKPQLRQPTCATLRRWTCLESRIPTRRKHWQSSIVAAKLGI